MPTIHVDIVSAERAIFSGEAEMVFAPAMLGEVGIAPGHAAMLTRMSPGEVRVQLVGGEQQAFYVSGGMLEVQPKIVTVLSDTAVRAHDQDEEAVLRPNSSRKITSKIAAARWICQKLKPNSPNSPHNSKLSSACVVAAAKPPSPSCAGNIRHNSRTTRI
jgi:F-type H+-transporting ATPase subunit epsilon